MKDLLSPKNPALSIEEPIKRNTDEDEKEEEGHDFVGEPERRQSVIEIEGADDDEEDYYDEEEEGEKKESSGNNA